MDRLSGLVSLRREEIVRSLVHFPASGDEPFYVEVREVCSHGVYEIEAWLVASGKDMRNACTRYAYYVCELGLTEILGR